MTSGTIWQRSNDWVGSQVEDNFVMLSLEGGEYISLNGTAAEIWHALAEPSDEARIADLLVEKYNVDRAHCLLSIRNLLDNLAAKGLAKQVD